MKRTTLVAGMLAVATTLIAGAAIAERRGGGGRGHDRLLGHIERRVEKLDLSAETKQAVYAALDEARGERRTLADELRAAHEQMRAALDEPSPSLDAVLAQADAIGALETRAKKIELAAVVKVRGLLTDEQWKELRPQRRHGRPGERPDRSGASPAPGGAQTDS